MVRPIQPDHITIVIDNSHSDSQSIAGPWPIIKLRLCELRSRPKKFFPKNVHLGSSELGLAADSAPQCSAGSAGSELDAAVQRWRRQQRIRSGSEFGAAVQCWRRRQRIRRHSVALAAAAANYTATLRGRGQRPQSWLEDRCLRHRAAIACDL